MNNFITNNETRNLKKRLVELIKKSEELKFLVGFFYFSGIRELYQGLKANPSTVLKVLVGLNVDSINFNLIEFEDNARISDEEKIHRFFISLKKSFNNEDFDTKNFYEQAVFFLELIRNDRLIIRKTFEPNHAKLYLFKLDREQVGKRNLFITGSSNLTKAGLSLQKEFNVEIGDYGFDDAESYFETLWDDAVKITEYEDVKSKLIGLIENDTHIKSDVTPFAAFCLILKTYLDSFEQKEVGESLLNVLEENHYKAYKYQLDAVMQARTIIEANNGVIIADVTGLGKTIIGCAIAKEMRKRGIVVCPPAQVGDKGKNSGWRKYLEEFRLYDWEAYSLGDLESVQEAVSRARDIELVIVDEAHRFRNQDTRDYELLKNICRDKQVILLTATPFNNRPGDILSLLKLFITPKKSSITLGNNLVGQFSEFKGTFDKLGYIKKYWNSGDESKRLKALTYYTELFGEDRIDLKKVAERARYLAKQIRNVIEPVTIRRNRLDLKGNPFYAEEVGDLPEVADPQEWYFELTGPQSDFYTEIIQEYFYNPDDPDGRGLFKGAIYRPFEYEKGPNENMNIEENRQYQQQRNLYDFMRRMLVKRFESSFGSFEQSIRNFIKITETCRNFIEKTGEYILDRGLIDKIYSLDSDEIEARLQEYEEKINRGEYPKNHKRYKLKNFKRKKEFVDHINSDIHLFHEILEKLDRLGLVENDPKTKCLVKYLKKEFAKKPDKNEPERKIIIFSEYVDTVLYLEKELKKHFGGAMLVVPGVLPQNKIKVLNRNFDAVYPEQEDTYKLLLTSDKISEGFNLNRAGMVINYDIPWNPVRVIQRLGRINRISKKVFDLLYIVNFFPTKTGSELVKSREIAANKMFLIHSALGEDSKIFDIDEEPTPAGLFNRVQQNPDKAEGESFYTKALRVFLEIKRKHPELIKELGSYPPRVKVAKKGLENELLVFFKKGRLYVKGTSTRNEKPEPFEISFEDAYERIVCLPEEKCLEWNTDKFWDFYQAVKEHSETRDDGLNELSLEARALKNLEFLIRDTSEELMPYKDFLRMLREDVLDYGTLPDFTLRRIMNIKANSFDELNSIQKELGTDYLTKEKNRRTDRKKEIIIAVQNIAG